MSWVLSWFRGLQRSTVGYAVVVLGLALFIADVLPAWICFPVMGLGLEHARGLSTWRAATWFDDPFWSDWLYWAGVAPLFLILSLTADRAELVGPAWIPGWVGVILAAMLFGYILGIVTGTVRAFVRGLRDPHRLQPFERDRA